MDFMPLHSKGGSMRFLIGKLVEKPAKMPLYEGGPVVDTTVWQVQPVLQISAEGLGCLIGGRKRNAALQGLGMGLWEKHTCSRCLGGKYFRCWSHVWGGRCFRCGAAGYTLKAIFTPAECRKSLRIIEGGAL